jgi:hypothetical protein
LERTSALLNWDSRCGIIGTSLVMDSNRFARAAPWPQLVIVLLTKGADLRTIISGTGDAIPMIVKRNGFDGTGIIRTRFDLVSPCNRHNSGRSILCGAMDFSHSLHFQLSIGPKRSSVRLQFGHQCRAALQHRRGIVASISETNLDPARARQRVPLVRISNNHRAGPLAEKALRAVPSQPIIMAAVPIRRFHHSELPIGNLDGRQDVLEFAHIIYRSMRSKENATRPLQFAQTRSPCATAICSSMR